MEHTAIIQCAVILSTVIWNLCLVRMLNLSKKDQIIAWVFFMKQGLGPPFFCNPFSKICEFTTRKNPSQSYHVKVHKKAYWWFKCGQGIMRRNEERLWDKKKKKFSL